jgi:GTPase SAR1 family protein
MATTTTTTKKKIFNCIIVGDSGVGKSNFIRLLTTGDFVKSNNSQTADEGDVIFVINNNVDTNLHQKEIRYLSNVDINFHLKEIKYDIRLIQDIKGADCAIIMCDETVGSSENYISQWENIIKNISNIPIVVAANSPNILPEVYSKLLQMGIKLPTTVISTKLVINLYEPFKILTEKLIGDLIKITSFKKKPEPKKEQEDKKIEITLKKSFYLYKDSHGEEYWVVPLKESGQPEKILWPNKP